MSQSSKIALFTTIGVGVLALLAYGFFASRRLDTTKELHPDSNINEFIYDEDSDTLEVDDELEDLYDGSEVVDEDNDFEVYQEADDWEDVPPDTTSEVVTFAENLASPEDQVVATGVKKEEDKEVQSAPQAEQDQSTRANDQQTGDFVVVVGSYSSKTNARKKLKSLEEIGFTGTIDQLSGSRLQSVLAGRFESSSAAQQQANKIEKLGLRAIVRELD